MFTLKRSRQFVALTLGCLLSGAALAGTISTFAGSGANGHQDGALSAAQFSAPMGLALDGVSSTLYLSDSHSIRSIQNGVVTTLAGDGTTAVFNLPSDLALDNAGNLYIIDQNNQSLKRLELATGLVTVVLDGTQLTDPQGVTVDDTGMVYVADAGANQILKVDATVTPATVTPLVLDAPATALIAPQALAINGTQLFVAEPQASRVRVIDLSVVPATLFTVAGGTSKFFYNFASPGIDGQLANLKEPTDLTLDAMGNLYISDVGHNRVLKWDVATQLVSVVAGVGSSFGVGGFSGDGGQGRLAEIDRPVGLVVDSTGMLYFVDGNNQRIRSVANDMMAAPATTTTTPTTTGNAATGNSATGQTLYVASCASCHGADPVNNTLKVANGTSAGIITTQHAFVGAADALNLAAYISSRVGTATTPVTAPATGTATGTATTGNSANGQALYATGCASCHGGDPINNGLNVANGVSALVITSKHSFVVSVDAVDLAAYISSRVGTATTPVTGTSSGGAALYASKCAGCHGADPINNRQDIASGTSASEIRKQHGTQYSSSAESTQIAAYISTRVLGSGGSAVDSISSASGGDDDDDDDDDEGFGGSTAPMLLLMLLGAAVLRRRFVA